MVLGSEYGKEALLGGARRILPDNEYHTVCFTVCFGHPTAAVNLERTNRYAAEAGREPRLYPLVIAGKGPAPQNRLRRELETGGFYGYKVYLPWVGDDYGNLRVEDMLSPVEMELPDRHSLIVLLHVPRSGRLADPEVQAGVQALARDYPGARLVLARCGRCCHPEEMAAAAPALAGLENVYLDSSMVMDPTLFQILIEYVPSQRLLFGSDVPVAAMRGRRVYVMDQWVDMV